MWPFLQFTTVLLIFLVVSKSTVEPKAQVGYYGGDYGVSSEGHDDSGFASSESHSGKTTADEHQLRSRMPYGVGVHLCASGHRTNKICSRFSRCSDPKKACIDDFCCEPIAPQKPGGFYSRYDDVYGIISNDFKASGGHGASRSFASSEGHGGRAVAEGNGGVHICPSGHRTDALCSRNQFCIDPNKACINNLCCEPQATNSFYGGYGGGSYVASNDFGAFGGHGDSRSFSSSEGHHGGKTEAEGYLHDGGDGNTCPQGYRADGICSKKFAPKMCIGPNEICINGICCEPPSSGNRCPAGSTYHGQSCQMSGYCSGWQELCVNGNCCLQQQSDGIWPHRR